MVRVPGSLQITELEYEINNFIKLRLEKRPVYGDPRYGEVESVENRIAIYVNDVEFITCKHLLLSFPKQNIEDMQEIDSIDKLQDYVEELDKNIEKYIEENSIDKIYDTLDRSLERGNPNPQKFTIEPEEEFWGHCSNLQAWAENNYDTRILHSNISFPLLKRLYECGDPIAKKVYKDEILKRINGLKFYKVRGMFNDGFFSVFNKEELDTIAESFNNPLYKLWLTKQDTFIKKFNFKLPSYDELSTSRDEMTINLLVYPNLPLLKENTIIYTLEIKEDGIGYWEDYFYIYHHGEEHFIDADFFNHILSVVFDNSVDVLIAIDADNKFTFWSHKIGLKMSVLTANVKMYYKYSLPHNKWFEAVLYKNKIPYKLFPSEKKTTSTHIWRDYKYNITYKNMWFKKEEEREKALKTIIEKYIKDCNDKGNSGCLEIILTAFEEDILLEINPSKIELKILETCNRFVKTNDIMYECLLKVHPKKELKRLKQEGLLIYENGKYRTTILGKFYIANSKIKDIKSFLDIEKGVSLIWWK